jgi:hypothetical protein
MRKYYNHKIWSIAFLLLIFSPGCCNPGANPSLTPPTVVSVTPLSGAAGVCPNSVVTATFSVAMNPATINATTFTLTGPGTTAVAGVVTYNASSNTATFTPSSALALSTLYTATITTGAIDEYGIALATNFVWTFTTGDAPCLPGPPTVVFVTPPTGAAGVCPNSVVTATFSEAMNPSTINTTTFTLTGPGTTPVTGVVAYDASSYTATFTPSSILALDTLFTATITTGVQDPSGNALASNYVWTFTTALAACTTATPPTVISVTPLAGAVGVCPSTIVTATFSVAMNPATINATTFTLTGPGTTPVTGVVTYDASSNTATFTPSNALVVSTLYTATITTGAIDENGVALASNFVWTFTTAAEPCGPPTVLSVTPPNLAVGICPSSVVTATFSEAMNPATINTTTFTLTGPGTTPVTGVVTYAGSTATFTPTSALALNTLYTATITTGAQNLNGTALASNYVWTFTTATTACTPPTIISVAPPNLAVDICPGTLVVATFSEAMNPATINTTTFTLTGPGTTPVTGTVTYVVSSYVATFTPTSPLALDTLFTATITTGAQDLAGDPLASNYVWTFTTNTTACAPIVPLGSACSFGILGGSTVTNSGVSTFVSGDIGVWPGTAITGFTPSNYSGTLHAGDAVAQTAQGDLTTAYNFAAAAPGGAVLPADIGGETLVPGVYETTSAQPSLGITGNLTLSGNGVYIFQIVSTLTTAANNSDVILSGGATSEDVFWQVGSSATLGTTTTFAGTIMAQASVSLDTGATLNGRALARTGAVTLLSNQVNVPPCP